jgi:hypothetical protein
MASAAAVREENTVDDYQTLDPYSTDAFHPTNCACCMSWGDTVETGWLIDDGAGYSDATIVDDSTVWTDPLAIGAPPTPDLVDDSTTWSDPLAIGAPPTPDLVDDSTTWSDPLAIGAPPTPDLVEAVDQQATIDLSATGSVEQVPVADPQGSIDLSGVGSFDQAPLGDQQATIDLSGVGSFDNLAVGPDVATIELPVSNIATIGGMDSSPGIFVGGVDLPVATDATDATAGNVITIGGTGLDPNLGSTGTMADAIIGMAGVVGHNYDVMRNQLANMSVGDSTGVYGPATYGPTLSNVYDSMHNLEATMSPTYVSSSNFDTDSAYRLYNNIR